MERRSPSERDVATGASGMRHVPALDGLRGLAVAAVLAFHAEHLRGGFLGVDLFFVLSGYLITSLLLHEARAVGRIDLGRFWARRARRLLPALFGMLVGVAVYAAVWARPNELDTIRRDSFATLFYVANWHTVFSGHGYWDLFAAPSPLQHAWSLAIEEQFYVVWPLVFLALLVTLTRRARRAGRSPHIDHVTAPVVLGVALGLAAASAALMAVLYRPGHDPERVYLGTDTRAAAILIGAALAAFLSWRGPVAGRGARFGLELVAFVGVVTVGWAWVHFDGANAALYQGGFLALEVAAIAVIACVVHPVSGPLARALSFAPLRALGLISYGLYLWHWPVFLVLTSARTGLDGGALVAFRVGVSFVFALTSFFALEQPIRRGALAGRPIRVLTPIAALGATAAIVFTTVGAAARPALHTAEVARVATTAAPGVAATGTLRVLVAGDSVAYHLGQSLERLQVPLGISATDAALDGCALERGATAARYFNGSDAPLGRDCTTGWRDRVDAFRPDVVVVVLAGQILGDWRVDGSWSHLCEANYDGWYARQVRDGIETLAATGARVVLAAPPPSTLPWMPAPFNERVRCLGAIERQIARTDPRARFIDLSTLVCPHGACRNDIDHAVLRPDGLHFDGPGADVVTRWLVPQLRAIVEQPR